MNRDRLRELILLLAIGSALTVAVLALWLLPFKVVRDVSLSFRRS